MSSTTVLKKKEYWDFSLDTVPCIEFRVEDKKGPTDQINDLCNSASSFQRPASCLQEVYMTAHVMAFNNALDTGGST